MRIFTEGECAKWIENRFPPVKSGKVLHDPALPHVLRSRLPSKLSQLLWFSRFIEQTLQPRESCLAWVTDAGVFTSSENLHLFYRFRQTYGEYRLLDEAPGHFCLDFERAEVASLIYMSILFGWDLHLLPDVGYGRGFVSHDEYVELAFQEEGACLECVDQLRKGGVDVRVREP